MCPDLQPYVSPLLYLEVLDDLERLLGHVLLSADANGNAASEAEGALQLSPAILEALLSHLRRPPAAGRQLMIIGVTAARRIIGRTPLLGTFDAVVQLPSLAAEANGPPGAAVRRLLWLCGAAAEASEELALLSALVPPSMPLKQILHAVELSRLPPAEPRTPEAEGAAEAAGAEAAGAAAEGVAAEAGAAETEGAARPARGAQTAREARGAEEAEAAEEPLSDALVTAALPYRSHQATYSDTHLLTHARFLPHLLSYYRYLHVGIHLLAD